MKGTLSQRCLRYWSHWSTTPPAASSKFESGAQKMTQINTHLRKIQSDVKLHELEQCPSDVVHSIQHRYSIPAGLEAFIFSLLLFTLIHYLGFSGLLLSISLFLFLSPIKSTLPLSFYSPVVTNIAFSVNLNRLTLKQTTHSDTGSKTCTHALPHAQLRKESPMHTDKATACVKIYTAQKKRYKRASPRPTVLRIPEQTATTN